MAGVRRKKSKFQSDSSKRAKTIDLGWTETTAQEDDDEIVDSDQDLDDDNRQQEDDSSSEEEALEAKRVRLAREYLDKVEGVSSSEDDDDDEEEEQPFDRISSRLQRQRLKKEGKLERILADRIGQQIQSIHEQWASVSRKKTTTMDASSYWLDEGHIQLFKGHDLTPTCVSLDAKGERAVSGSKDHSVLLWDMEHEKLLSRVCPTWKKNDNSNYGSRTNGQVLSVACTDDGRYAAVGRHDATTFTGHKGPITCLTFRSQSYDLFSGSQDRCIRHYSLNEMLYLETLYGHQFGVSGIDCHLKDRPISVGRDRTARGWKLAEDTHLIFRGGSKVTAPDCVSVVKDDWFLTGHENGQLSLWLTDKKRPVATIEQAHHESNSSIASIDALKGSDLAATGSNDGYLRLWKVRTGLTNDDRGIESLAEIPIKGFINDIAIGPKAKFCVVAVGQEPRLGRWNRVPKAKNRIAIVRLDSESQEKNQGDEDDEDYDEPEGVRSPSSGSDQEDD